MVVFALLSQSLRPKRFAGLFSAAPAVAIASLSVTLLDKSAHDAHQSAVGMIAGAAGMIAYATVCIPLLRRMSALPAGAMALGAWTTATALILVPVLLG